MRILIPISFLVIASMLFLPTAEPQMVQVVVAGKKAAAATTISGCSGPMTYTGSTGCVKRELFDGATSCYSGFSSNCNNAWDFAAGATFNYSTSPAPLQGTYSAYVADGTGNKIYLGYTAASNIYVGAAVNFAAFPSATSIPSVRIDTTIDTAVCRAEAYGSGYFQVANAGGTTQYTPVTLSTGTTYYILVRAVPGTGANARCDAWLSTNGTSWGYSVSSTDGTWTANTGYVHIENFTGTTSAHQVIDDIRISSSSFNYW